MITVMLMRMKDLNSRSFNIDINTVGCAHTPRKAQAFPSESLTHHAAAFGPRKPLGHKRLLRVRPRLWRAAADGLKALHGKALEGVRHAC